MTARLFLPAGSGGDDVHDLNVDPTTAGWDYSGLRIVSLAPGEELTVATGRNEMAILPLQGGCTVEVRGHRFDIAPRDSVFHKVSGFAYVPIDEEVQITSPTGGEIAMCTALAGRRIDPYAVPAAGVPVEVRGGGAGTRQINNFLSADMYDADKLICVEVITPESNWSSYPPHKHDEFSDDEVELEEIYYFRIEGEHGIGMFNLYTSDGEIGITEVVRDGDIVLVPRGYHGPAAAAPGHHMYYLNVMAGPSEERVWKFCDDPDHHWARAMLDSLDPDPRLPLTTAEGRTD